MYLGTTATTAIIIGSRQYSLNQLYNKTLYAAKPVPVYKTYLSAQPEFTLPVGSLVGVVQGFVAKGHNGSPRDYFLIGPNTRDVKAVPYTPVNFSETKLRQQGAKDTKETFEDKEKEAEVENTEWYIKIIKTVMPYAAIALVGYLLLKNKK